MRIYNLNTIILTGCLGVLIILYGIITSSINYIGCSGENYNVLNHFVSELGQYKCSEKAKIFNLSLIFGTPFLIFYYLKIIPDSSKNIKVLFKWIISIIGLSAISIGIFSMDNTLIHVVSALIFFYLCFFSSLLFNIYFLFMKKQELPKHFLISGIFISFTTLINIIQFHQLDSRIILFSTNIIFVCIIEWICLLSMLLFFISSVIFFRKKVRNKDRKAHQIDNPTHLSGVILWF